MKNRAYRKISLMLAFLFVAVANAASVQLTPFDGSAKALEAYTGKGKWVIAMIWAHDCHVCNQEAKEYVTFHQKHQSNKAVVLGISMDGKSQQKKAQKFVDRHQIPFTSLIGEPENVAGMYEKMTGRRWIGTPTFMIFHPSGKLVAEQAGAVPASLLEDFIGNYKDPAG
jgi:peroxiredoxin